MRNENPFRQWLEADTYNGNWVPIGQLGGWVAPTSNPVLFPAGQKEVMLSDSDWPIRIDGAQPEVWGYPDGGGEAHLRPRYQRDGVQLEPFAAYFNPPDWPSWLEPIQAFVLYLQAAPHHQAGGRIRWEVRDEDGKPEEVARWIPLEGEEAGGVLEIRRDVLLRFMRDFDFDLAIFYEDSRPVEGVGDGWRDDGREDFRSWRCWAANVGGDQVQGLLRAVTILERPPPAEHRPEDEDHGKTLEYVIGIDPRTGDAITDSFPGPPNEKTAHPGAGNDNFLTPIFFRPEVLEYYLSDPRHYTVTEVQVAAGGMWSIRIARTERDNIQVWLGDLGLISDRAQHHWRQFNISDDDAVPEWRERRDFKAEWVETPREGSVERVRQAIEECNQAAAAYCGVPLYAAVEGMNESRLAAMHSPLNSSLPAFQQQITSLAILVGDHVNADFLNTVGAPKGSPLNRLAEWLEGMLGVSRDDARDLIGGVYAVQAVRSEAGAAHRAGERANEVLARAGVDPDDLPAGFDKLAEGAASSIDRVRDVIRSLAPNP